MNDTSRSFLPTPILLLVAVGLMTIAWDDVGASQDTGRANPRSVDRGQVDPTIVDHGYLDPRAKPAAASRNGEPSARMTYLPTTKLPELIVPFEPNHATLSEAGLRALKRVPLLLVVHPTARLALPAPKDDAEADLLPARRRAVLAQLARYGVPPAMLQAAADKSSDSGVWLALVLSTK